MKKQVNLLKGLQWICLISIGGVVVAGLIWPVSVFAGFVLQPLAILVLLGVFGFADYRLAANTSKAKVYSITPQIDSPVTTAAQSRHETQAA